MCVPSLLSQPWSSSDLCILPLCHRPEYPGGLHQTDFVCFQYITQLYFRTAFLFFLSGKFCVIQDLQVPRVSERVRETRFSCSAISSGIFHFSSLILSTELLGNLNETNILLHFFCVILAWRLFLFLPWKINVYIYSREIILTERQPANVNRVRWWQRGEN